jgi:hypothetical protein
VVTGDAAVQPPPVVDANGDPVDVPEGVPLEVARVFYAERVPAAECPHYLAASEARAGFKTCERCG